jgi:putative polyketide hydroxylase
VLAADGARSRVRDWLGVQMEGPRNVRNFVNVYFRADLSRWTSTRPAMLFWILNESLRGVFQPLDGRERWLCQIPYDGTEATRQEYTPQRCAEWIRAAIGSDAVQPQILSIENWNLSSIVANKLVHNRVVLTGDAAHQIPPIGGFGVNTAIQGVHNLVWKLALMRAGVAGRELLETYDVERRAIARYNGDRSVENTMLVEQIAAAATGDGDLTPAQAVAASTQYGNFIGMELGYCYESDAVQPDGTAPRHADNPITEYVPDARPGSRAPHVAIELDGTQGTTIDLVSGPRFAVLAGPDGERWRTAASAVADEFGLTIDVHLIGAPGEWADPGGDFCTTFGISQRGAVLVRPDGHVAYRRYEDAADTLGELRQALGRVLARQPSVSSS